jgi:hypothetical protein
MATANPSTNMNKPQNINNNNNNNNNNNKNNAKPTNSSGSGNSPPGNGPPPAGPPPKKISNENTNTIKKAISNSNNNNNNAIKESKQGGPNNNIKTTGQESIEQGQVITSNYLLFLAISIVIVICIVIYIFSQSFRVSRAINNMKSYQNYQRLSSLNYSKFGGLRLGDMYISSSYNSAHCGYQMYDYTSEKIVLAILQSGARYLEFNVFNSEFGENAYPVVSMGYKKGEWKMMVSDTPLESIFQIIVDNAFMLSDGVNGVSNPEDPLFLGLNLNTNSNLNCLNLISFLITKFFGNKLLPNQYSYQNSDLIADIRLSQVSGKVIIFTSDGFQGCGLEEIVNYSWDNINNNPNHSLQRIHYSTLIAPDFDGNKLIKFNKKGLTIVVPHLEGDFLNTNYDTTIAMELGCQFIAMEFQYINYYMDSYITLFKNVSLIQKEDNLIK